MTPAVPPQSEGLIEVTLGGHRYPNVELKWSHYVDDPENVVPALRLIVDGEYGPEPLAVATVNLPDVELADGCILVKDWAENEGMFESLIDAGVIEDSGDSVEVNRWGSFARQGRVLPPYDAGLRAAIDRGLAL